MSERTVAVAPRPELPSGLVTFLFTDVVASTRLFQEHGDAFVEALFDVQDAVRRAVEASGGVVVGTEGDSTFAAFADPASAVAAAVRAQRAVADLAVQPTLAIRAGLHSGYAQPLQDDYIAVPVHVAARVASAANAGQVLASGETVGMAGAPPPHAADLGLFELRDVREPVRLWRVHGSEEPPRASPLRRTNVPPAHTSLIGRRDELDHVAELLTTNRLVTLVGTGGIGKTRLASEIATRLAPSLAGGAWLVELAAAETDSDVLPAVHATLGISGGDGTAEAVAADLARRGETLIILDNCEHVLDGAAETAEHLLRHSPSARLLATSREALELPDERVLRIGALSAPDESGAAEELFRERAGRAGADLALAADDIVGDVCRMLDGLPLAIELAASRAASMPLTELRAALEHDAHLLPLGGRRGNARQRTLDGLVDWSVRLLTSAERIDLMCLSVFAARFTGADAAALLAQVRGERSSPLLELVRRSLVDLDGDRYRVLFSVRVPMRRLLAADADLYAAAEGALVTWANERVETARPAGWRGALEDLAPERANLEAALRAALRRNLPAPRVLQMLDRIWDRDGTGIPADLREAMTARLQEPAPTDVRDLAMVLSIVGATRTTGFSGQLPGGLAPGERLLARARELNDPATLADALSTIGPLYMAAGRVDEARLMYFEAIAAADAGGVWSRPARNLVNLAVSYHVEGDYEQALPWYERAVDAAVQTGDDSNRAIALVNLGDALMITGRLRQATDVLRKGIRAMSDMSRTARAARGILAEALVRLDEPNALEYARDAEREMTEFSRLDSSMNDYLERLRITIHAAEQRVAERAEHIDD